VGAVIRALSASSGSSRQERRVHRGEQRYAETERSGRSRTELRRQEQAFDHATAHAQFAHCHAARPMVCRHLRCPVASVCDHRSVGHRRDARRARCWSHRRRGTWGRPAETGFYPEPGLHIKQRGWAVYAWQWNYDSTNKWADAPLWPLLVATLLPFAVHTSRTRRRQRRGRCVWCGYDLGTLGQCPECGRVTKAGTQRYLREQKGA
jgi:hypothetical protein